MPDFRSISALTDVGDQFTDGYLRYKITKISPNAVKVVDYIGPGGDLEIPFQAQSIQKKSYSINFIGDGAFDASGQKQQIVLARFMRGLRMLEAYE